MNYRDYEFLELHPDYDVDNFRYVPFRDYIGGQWNDLKALDDKVLLSDPDFYKVLQSSFIDKVRDAKYSIIKNEATGEYCFPMVPFRGNPAYSRKKHKRIQPIIDAFKGKEFSKPVKGSRNTEIKLVQSILITLTYTHEDSEQSFTKQGYPTKKWNHYDAWESITPLVNQFKMELSRVIGNEQIKKGHGTEKEATYGSCLVKEGTESMYPAPHLIVVFDKPMLAHRYGKQWLLGGQAHDRSLVDEIQAIWERLAGSHCKINAIVSAGGFAYVFKYVMKSIDLTTWIT